MENLQLQIFIIKYLNLIKKVASIGTLGVKANNFNLKLNNTTIDPIKLGKIMNPER